MLTFITQILIPVVIGRSSLGHVSWQAAECRDPWEHLAWPNRLMLLAVTVMYLTKVVPDQLWQLHRKFNDSTSGISKLRNIRVNVWHKDADSLAQKIGFRINFWMNTICACFGLLVFLVALPN